MTPINTRMATLIRNMAANPERFPEWNSEAAELAKLLPDADLVDARECAAIECETRGAVEMAKKYRAGQRDNASAVRSALIAIRKVKS